jgi:hypothetical protein
LDPKAGHCCALALQVMVLEFLEGGELLDQLHAVHHFDEAQAAGLFRQVAKVGSGVKP